MTKPNIVVVMPDDLGWGDIGNNPHTAGTAHTPHLGAFLTEALFFSRHYVQSLCSPTRCSLHTGRYPFRQGMSRLLLPWSVNGIRDVENPLPRLLAGAGYVTALVGKWHLGHFKPKIRPLGRGYQYHYGCYTGWVDPYTHRNRGGHDWHRNGVPVYEDGHATDLLAAEACRLIAGCDYDSHPLFLTLTFTAPHTPLAVERHLARYKDLPENHAKYFATVTHMDEALGRVFAALDAAGQANNTAVLFLCDNGVERSNGGTTPWRGAKAGWHDGAIRVPAAIKVPGGTPGVYEGLAHAVDWYATLLALAGVPVPADPPTDGIDLLAAAAGTGPARQELVIDLKNGAAGVVADAGRWKYLIPPGKEPELYDLFADPTETANVFDQFPDVAGRLAERLASYEGGVYLSPNRPDDIPQDQVPAVWGNP